MTAKKWMTIYMRHHTALIGILALASLVAMVWPTPGLAQGLARQALLTSGDHTVTLPHEGKTRIYLVHVPPQAEMGEALPVVLSLHGGGGHGGSQQQYTLMDAVADREGFLVVYPSGTGYFRKRLLTWNAGTCCSYAMDHEVDDVGFLLAVLDDLVAQTHVDERRIYATGLSNGAMMSYRLAAEASPRIAAIAPVAGSMVVKEFSPRRPVPLLHIHSLDDQRALYDGGLGVPFPLTNRRTFHPSVETALARWVEHNGCPAEPVIEDTRAGAPGTREEDHTATKIVYAPCNDGVEVILWKLTGAGHVWPGGKQDHLKHIIGPSTRIIDANEEIWAFFSRHVLPESTSGAD